MKFTALVAFLALASLVSAAPMIKLGNETAPFEAIDSTVTIAGPAVYDLYIWASSDIARSEADTATGIDTVQVALKFNNIGLVNLQGAAIAKWTAVSGNPFGATIAGKSYSGTDTIKGALLSLDGVDQFGMTKLFKLTLDAKAGGVVTLLNSTSPLETFAGNSVAQTKYPSSGSVTFISEPAPPTPEPNIPPIPTPEPNVTPTPEPNVTPPPPPAPITQAHGAILVYKVLAAMSGYTFNPMTTPRTIRPYSASVAGFFVADVNTATLQTNYPSSPDANSPSLIAVINNSLVTFNCSDPNVTAAFDLARSDNPYCRMFNLSTTSTVRVGRTSTTKTTISTLIFPQFNFVYTRPADGSTAAFYDNQLMGNVGPVDIGMPAKAAVPTAIVGSANFDMGQFHKVFGSVTLTLDTTYTRLANKADYRVAKTVNLIKSDLAKRYKQVSLSTFFGQ